MLRPSDPETAVDCPHPGNPLFLEESVRTLVEAASWWGPREPIVW